MMLCGTLLRGTFVQIEAQGAKRWLERPLEELISGQYAPRPLLRISMRKSNRSRRPLGIPTIRDRVVQMAVVLVIGPSSKRTCCRSSMASALGWAPRWSFAGPTGT